MKFDGSGARDLFNQVITSSMVLSKFKLESTQGIFREYYRKLFKRNCDDNTIKTLTEEDFIKLFEKEIVYVAGFLNSYSETYGSEYAKFLVIDYYMRLEQNGHKLLVVNINEKQY